MEQYNEAVELWRSYKVNTTADLDKYLDSFRILFAHHSCKIQNHEVMHYDTITGHQKALFEQQNQKICYDFLKDKIILKEPISIKLVKKIHSAMASDAYGEYHYNEFEYELYNLIKEVNEYGNKGDVLKIGTYLYAMFEYIHPFADGNGLVGRMLLNYFLMIHDHPPLIVYEEDCREYYSALQKYDEYEELDDLYEFFKKQTIKTWIKKLELNH